MQTLRERKKLSGITMSSRKPRSLGPAFSLEGGIRRATLGDMWAAIVRRFGLRWRT